MSDSELILSIALSSTGVLMGIANFMVVMAARRNSRSTSAVLGLAALLVGTGVYLSSAGWVASLLCAILVEAPVLAVPSRRPRKEGGGERAP